MWCKNVMQSKNTSIELYKNNFEHLLIPFFRPLPLLELRNGLFLSFTPRLSELVPRSWKLVPRLSELVPSLLKLVPS